MFHAAIFGLFLPSTVTAAAAVSSQHSKEYQASKREFKKNVASKQEKQMFLRFQG
jgi:hypothetical protein